MLKLLKLKVLITIVLLSYSINLLAKSDYDATFPSTGEVVNRNDSVLISYDDLRRANSKLIQLDYEKQINTNLRNIISNDSIVIRDYQVLNEKINKDCKKAIRQRNIAIGGAAALFITTIVTLFVK